MLKKTLLLALCSGSCLSHAGWDIPIMNTAEVKYYADPETKRTSILPSVWILADYDRPQHRADHDPDYLSVKVLNEADCSAGALRVVSSIYYSLGMGKGDALSYSTLSTEWAHPAPRTPWASVFDYLCPAK